MSFFLANTAKSSVTSPTATLYKLIMAVVAFTKYQKLVLEIMSLNAGSHVSIYIGKKTQVYEKLFTL